MDVRTYRNARRCAWLFAVTAMVAIAGCGDGSTGPTDTTSVRDPAESTDAPAPDATTLDGATDGADETWRAEIDVVGCDQVVSRNAVEPAQAAPFVADDQELFLDDSGLARVLLVVKDCDDFVVDGVSLGPGHMDTLWVRVLGPAEGAPEASDEIGSTTDTFVPQFIQTDNAAYSEAVNARGVPLLLADEMTADPPGTDDRSGSATNSTFDPPLSYRWTVPDSGFVAQEGIATHLLRGVDTDGSPIRYDITCPFEITGGGSVTVEFEPDGPFAALLANGRTSLGYEMRLDCQIVVEPR